MADYLTEALKHGRRPSTASKNPEERKLGRALVNYTCKGSGSHDPVFDKKIHRLRPDWFENTADIKKKKLLELARTGAKNQPVKKNGWAKPYLATPARTMATTIQSSIRRFMN